MKSARSQSGFTLVEVLAVVVLMALLATATMFAMVATLRKSEARSALERWQHFDRSTRLMAQTRYQPMLMLFDLNRQRFLRRQVVAVSTENLVPATEAAVDATLNTATDVFITLPRSAPLAAVVLANTLTSATVLAAGDSAGEGNTVVIPCSAQGRTPSYAIGFIDHTGSNPATSWWVVAGLTGEQINVPDEKAARTILQQTVTQP